MCTVIVKKIIHEIVRIHVLISKENSLMKVFEHDFDPVVRIKAP